MPLDKAPQPASPRISAICTTLNCLDGMAESVEFFSRACQTGHIQEIVLVDGGSTDGTWELLERLAAERPYLRVARREGLNISAGRNEAVRLASGNILLCFDSGCAYPEGWVEEMVAPFGEADPPDVTGGRTRCVGRTPFEKIVAALYSRASTDRVSPSHRAVAYTRAVFEAVGGYREDVPAGEDTYFNAEWRRQGFRFRYVPEAVVDWRMRSSLRGLYRMTRRNTYGRIKLGEAVFTWSLVVRWIVYVAAVALLAGGIWCPWSALPGGAVLAGYLCSRLLTRGRWRTFVHPGRFAVGAAAVMAMDMGSLIGSARGLAGYLRTRKTPPPGPATSA